MSRAAVLYDGGEFFDSANHAQNYLKEKGFTVDKADCAGSFIAALGALPEVYQLVVLYSHGGWDGPLAFEADAGVLNFQSVPPSQDSSALEGEEWNLFLKVLRDRICPNGLFIVQACHSAGSNKWEGDDGTDQRWVRWVAEAMRDIYTLGVEGPTAAANHESAVALLEYAFTGQGAPQASRAYSPNGELVPLWVGWVAPTLK
jgi:hypothetical protein